MTIETATEEAAKLISREKTVSFLTDSLVGVLSGNYDDKEIRAERMKKQESAD